MKAKSTSMWEVARYSTVAYTEALSVEGARAYLGGGKGFEVLDLSCVLPYAGAFEGGEPRRGARP
jgi:hypothetical protein